MFEDFLRLTGLTVSGLAAFLRKLLQDAWLKSTTVETVIAVGDTSATVQHGLQRAYNGAVVVAASAAYALTVDLPSTNATRELTVRTTAAVATTPLTVRLRVF